MLQIALESTPNPSVKHKGCFQCSRRRIICDKSAPSCQKCIKKGIECSGLGRIRFANGIARRGLLRNWKVPEARRAGAQGNGHALLPARARYPTLRWPNELTKAPASRVTGSLEEDEEKACRVDRMAAEAPSASIPLLPWIAPVSPEARMLFSYFSEAVAPVMVVFDGSSNGYRSILLAMALENDVLCRAVGVVAAQHLSRERPELKDAASTGRAAVISRLRKDATGGSADKVFNKFTWATLIVLLVGETVTGSADYKFLLQMLLSLSKNSMSKDDDSVITTFLQAQTRTFESLGVPLIGEEIGVLTIMKAIDSLPHWLFHPSCPANSADRDTAKLIQKCFASACSIYTRRATVDTFGSESTRLSHDLVQQSTIADLITIMSPLSPTHRGAHALVWVCFLAGAEAADTNQRAFFVDYLNAIYARVKFCNIPAAIRSLQNIWSRNDSERWTRCILELSDVLIM